MTDSAVEPLAGLIAAGRALLGSSRNILILTGAGISADSGLATFRDPQGHWRKHRPEDLATPEAFQRDPRLVWEWYEARRQAAAAVAPNAAHEAIASFALRRDDVVIVTQNVDGLHTLAARAVAGAPLDGAENTPTRRESGSEHVDPRGSQWNAPADLRRALPLELHGCFYRVRCLLCGRRREHRERVDTSSAATLPRCPDCDGLLRPDVVWFGEPLGEPIDRAFGCASQSEVCLVVGTSAVVQPAAGVAMVTRRAGGSIIEVNPEPTPLTSKSELSIRGTAAAVVPALLSESASG